MAIIAKVEKGNVVILNEYGGKLRTFHPNSGGDAVFVDYNSSNGKILVTTERGTVLLCEESGAHLSVWYGNGSITMARWSGDDVFVQNRNGSCELRTKTGGWIKSL